MNFGYKRTEQKLNELIGEGKFPTKEEWDKYAVENGMYRSMSVMTVLNVEDWAGVKLKLRIDKTEIVVYSIKGIREQKGISIRELSELTGISKSHLSDIENNVTHAILPTLIEIAHILDVDIKDLYHSKYDKLKKPL